MHMEVLPTVKTIWGDAAWSTTSRDSAEDILRQDIQGRRRQRKMNAIMRTGKGPVIKVVAAYRSSADYGADTEAWTTG